MANAAQLALTTPVRILSVGYPGAGKTGALACLANAGFKLRVIAFDKAANMKPLLQFTKPECLPNIDILFMEDKLRMGGRFIETIGVPTAFTDAGKAMDNWMTTDAEGKPISLGASKDWGLDTIVVIDSLTAMGTAAMRQAMSLSNKTPLNRTEQVWGFAIDNQDQFVEKMASNANRFNLICLSHLKIIAPKETEKDDDDLTKDIKSQSADLMPTKLWPSALGRQLPTNIARHFPVTLLIEPVYKGKTVKRVIHTVTRPELDLKLPANLPPELDISDGFLQVFEALGIHPPQNGEKNG